MGLEEVTSNFHFGLAESAKPNPVSSSGHPTVINLKRSHPLTVNYIMAAIPAPAGFDVVAAIEPNANSSNT